MADQNFFYEEGKRIKAKGKLGVFVRRFFGLILVAIVVLGIVFTAMLQDSSFVDRLRRRLFYGREALVADVAELKALWKNGLTPFY